MEKTEGMKEGDLIDNWQAGKNEEVDIPRIYADTA